MMIHKACMSEEEVKSALKGIIDSLSGEDLEQLHEYSRFLLTKEKESSELIAFFEHMQKYALFDLEQLRVKANYEGRFGRLAVSIAQSIFSLLDLFGFLISDDNRLEDTKGNIKIALQLFFEKEIKQHQMDVLIDIYRNGVMHTYFPKMCSIRNENDEHILLQNGDIWDLNVHLFSKLLIERLNDYIEFTKKDSKLTFHLTRRYSKFVHHQEKSFEKYNSNLSKANATQLEITTTFPISLPQDTPPPVCYTKS